MILSELYPAVTPPWKYLECVLVRPDILWGQSLSIILGSYRGDHRYRCQNREEERHQHGRNGCPGAPWRVARGVSRRHVRHRDSTGGIQSLVIRPYGPGLSLCVTVRRPVHGATGRLYGRRGWIPRFFDRDYDCDDSSDCTQRDKWGASSQVCFPPTNGHLVEDRSD